MESQWHPDEKWSGEPKELLCLGPIIPPTTYIETTHLYPYLYYHTDVCTYVRMCIYICIYIYEYIHNSPYGWFMYPCITIIPKILSICIVQCSCWFYKFPGPLKIEYPNAILITLRSFKIAMRQFPSNKFVDLPMNSGDFPVRNRGCLKDEWHLIDISTIFQFTED